MIRKKKKKNKKKIFFFFFFFFFYELQSASGIIKQVRIHKRCIKKVRAQFNCASNGVQIMDFHLMKCRKYCHHFQENMAAFYKCSLRGVVL
jgi:hypothetical protein